MIDREMVLSVTVQKRLLVSAPEGTDFDALAHRLSQDQEFLHTHAEPQYLHYTAGGWHIIDETDIQVQPIDVITTGHEVVLW